MNLTEDKKAPLRNRDMNMKRAMLSMHISAGKVWTTSERMRRAMLSMHISVGKVIWTNSEHIKRAMLSMHISAGKVWTSSEDMKSVLLSMHISAGKVWTSSDHMKRAKLSMHISAGKVWTSSIHIYYKGPCCPCILNSKRNAPPICIYYSQRILKGNIYVFCGYIALNFRMLLSNA